MPPQGLIGNFYFLLTANFPSIPETVNTERCRNRPKYAKQAVVVPKDLLDNSNAPLDILNTGYKRNIKTANISILNYIKTPHKKTKMQIFNNLIITLKDNLIGIIFNINNDNPLTTGRSS